MKRIHKLYGIKCQDKSAVDAKLKELNLIYKNRYEFVAMLPIAYRFAVGKYSIYPKELYKELMGHGIKTGKDKDYVARSRGQFNLLRSAFRYFRGKYDDIRLFNIHGQMQHYCLSNAILDTYVKKDGQWAWDQPFYGCKSFK